MFFIRKTSIKIPRHLLAFEFPISLRLKGIQRTLYGIEHSRPVGAYIQHRPSPSLTRVVLGWLLETRVSLHYLLGSGVRLGTNALRMQGTRYAQSQRVAPRQARSPFRISGQITPRDASTSSSLTFRVIAPPHRPTLFRPAVSRPQGQRFAPTLRLMMLCLGLLSGYRTLASACMPSCNRTAISAAADFVRSSASGCLHTNTPTTPPNIPIVFDVFSTQQVVGLAICVQL
jgi:hypothetical protein